MKLQLPRQIFEKFLNTNFMQICPVGAELLHEDGGLRDKMELIIAFRSLRKRLKNNGLNVKCYKIALKLDRKFNP